jgi:hypothetical protein
MAEHTPTPRAEDVLAQICLLSDEERRRLCELLDWRPDLRPGYVVWPADYISVLDTALKKLLRLGGENAKKLWRFEKPKRRQEDRDRQILQLSERLTDGQIAGLLKIKRDTVKKARQRAKQRQKSSDSDS